MSRIHDMGGRIGDGAIPQKDDDVVFHHRWHARAMAITVASGSHGAWNIDAGRFARESLQPADYAQFSYYEKWVSALADILVKRGLLDTKDIERAAQLATNQTSQKPNSALSETALQASKVMAAQRTVTPYTRPSDTNTRFKIGDKVRTAAQNPNRHASDGHTRLPGYAMDRVGTIVRLHGNHVLPDSNAHFQGEAPEPLYGVQFTARELWGQGIDATGDNVVLDLWQNYLTPNTE
ncbi:MAG: nitrile hydratase beta subunit [Paracoccaceae bacterium]|jgi:nitrile hydratase beta subunit